MKRIKRLAALLAVLLPAAPAAAATVAAVDSIAALQALDGTKNPAAQVTGFYPGSLLGGGFFVWVELPEGAGSRALLPLALQAGVSFLPGTQFHLDSGGQSALRLAFSLYPEAALATAARRLGDAAQQLAATIGPDEL